MTISRAGAELSGSGLAAALPDANIPSLLPALTQLTGDLRWLADPYRPRPARGWDDNDSAGLDDAVQAEIRRAAFEALLKWRAGHPMALPEPGPELLVEMLSVAMSEAIPPEYGPMMASELTAHHQGSLAPGRASRLRERGGRPFEVVIIGAGMSGVCAAVALQQAGIAYTVLEAGDSVGGVWRQNRYPGAGVDTPSHLYCYSFAPNNWSQYYALREEIHGYFEQVARDRGVAEHVRFGERVTGAHYHADTVQWEVECTNAAGERSTRQADFLISAVGAFNAPARPDVPGLADFAGRIFHTAEWPDDLELPGQRVGVLGTGASAMQVVPRLAKLADQVVVLQRTAQWVAPFEKFRQAVPGSVQALMAQVPNYAFWYRMRLGWLHNDKTHPSLRKDPLWPYPDRSLNAVNNAHRRYLTRHALSQLSGREDLAAAVIPGYPPYGKRMLLDNGWYQALTLANVSLVTDPIERVTSSGVLMRSNRHHDLDVLVLATGFRVSQFLSTFELRGRRGVSLTETWGGDAKMFLGAMVPEFPNFFALYGPSTQPGHGGNVIAQVESQVRYLLKLFDKMFDLSIREVDVKADVYERYNARLDAEHQQMIWTHLGTSSYYRNARGRVLVTPERDVDFWHRTSTVDLADYNLRS